MPEDFRHSLLDSLSSDSDVPDLQLIPPSKSKRKNKIKKPTVPQISKLTLESPNTEIEGGRYKGGVILPRSWLCCLSFTIVSLVISVVTLAWYITSLSHGMELLQNEHKETMQRLSNLSKPVDMSVPSNRDDNASYKKISELYGKITDINDRIDSLKKKKSSDIEKSLSADLDIVKKQLANITSVVDKSIRDQVTDSQLKRMLNNTFQTIMSNISATMKQSDSNSGTFEKNDQQSQKVLFSPATSDLIQGADSPNATPSSSANLKPDVADMNAETSQSSTSSPSAAKEVVLPDIDTQIHTRKRPAPESPQSNSKP